MADEIKKQDLQHATCELIELPQLKYIANKIYSGLSSTLKKSCVIRRNSKVDNSNAAISTWGWFPGRREWMCPAEFVTVLCNVTISI